MNSATTTNRLPEMPPPESGIERRASPRYVSRRWRKAKLISRPSLRTYMATINDLGRASVGLISDTPFEPGSVLAIELHSAQAGLSCLLSAKVHHSTQQRDGTWLVGCTISKPLSDNELFALL